MFGLQKNTINIFTMPLCLVSNIFQTWKMFYVNVLVQLVHINGKLILHSSQCVLKEADINWWVSRISIWSGAAVCVGLQGRNTQHCLSSSLVFLYLWASWGKHVHHTALTPWGPGCSCDVLRSGEACCSSLHSALFILEQLMSLKCSFTTCKNTCAYCQWTWIHYQGTDLN